MPSVLLAEYFFTNRCGDHLGAELRPTNPFGSKTATMNGGYVARNDCECLKITHSVARTVCQIPRSQQRGSQGGVGGARGVYPTPN